MRWPFFWVFFFFFSCTGCERLAVPISVTLRQRAEKAESDGRYQQALGLYERCINDTPAGLEAHYRMALIYDSKIQNLVGALYHFQRFFEKSPRDPRIKEVLKDIQRLRLLLASQLSDGVLVSRAESIRLRNENLSLQAQLIVLRSKKEFSESCKAPSIHFINKGKTSITSQDVARRSQKSLATYTYQVEQGDTLAVIAKKFYKTSRRWKEIADANQSQLDGSTHLKVGMTLIIP